MSGNWCLIESDPGVFTEMLSGFGVKGVQIEELYTLEEFEFEKLRPVYGLVFLFKYRGSDDSTGKPAPEAPVFFCQQVIQNACATQAIINLIFNLDKEKHPEVDLGETLTEFKSFSTDFDPQTRGECLSNSEPIRTVHNSFARQQLFELDIKGGKEEDNYHFITFVPVGGKVYELDGLRECPQEIGTVADGGDWLDVVRPAIQERIQKYSEGEVHFNLMAVVADKKEKYVRRLAEITEAGMDAEAVAEEICDLQTKIEEEEETRKRWKIENTRRRHNYLPFIVEMLRTLAKEGKLVPYVQQSLDKARAKAQAEKDKPKAKA